MQLVVDHQRPDSQARGRLGGNHQRDERIDRADVVVGVQLVVAELLDLASGGDQAVVVVESREPARRIGTASLVPYPSTAETLVAACRPRR